MKSGRLTATAALLLLGLVLVNYLAATLPGRLDATADSIYSLSPGTRRMLGRIGEPITLDLYFSKDAPGLPVSYKNYAERVQEMLRQYVRAAHGRLTLNLITPRPDTPEEEKAAAAGLAPQVSRQGGQQFYFGLVVTQADQQRTIPAFTPQREQFLEYDLSKLIYTVQQLDKPKLGLLTSLPLQGPGAQDMQMLMMMRQRPPPAQFVVEEWRQAFDIVKIEPTATGLPDGLDVLAVIHPQALSPKLQFAIDQFLLGGKPVLLALDPASQYFKRQGGSPMMGGPTPNFSSDLPVLLGAYGVAYDPQKVVGDLENPLSVNGPDSSVLRLPTWLSLTAANLNAQSPATAQLGSAWFIEAGSLAAKPGSTLTFTPLVQTSGQSGEIDGLALQFDRGDDLAGRITPSGRKTIAALITGRFKSAFPQGPPEDPSPAKTAPAPSAAPAAGTKAEGTAEDAKAGAKSGALAESKDTSTLFVVADTDWLFDDYSVRRIEFFGQVAAEPYNDNLALAANVAELLGGSQDLLTIRGKGSALRPFTVVRRMEYEAQRKYQEKLSALDAELSRLQSDLAKLQGESTSGNRLVATPEMARRIEDFQKQQAAKRGERREIRRALREDIDRLENTLLAVNLLAMPLCICVFGLWFHRARKH